MRSRLQIEQISSQSSHADTAEGNWLLVLANYPMKELVRENVERFAMLMSCSKPRGPPMRLSLILTIGGNVVTFVGECDGAIHIVRHAICLTPFHPFIMFHNADLYPLRSFLEILPPHTYYLSAQHPPSTIVYTSLLRIVTKCCIICSVTRSRVHRSPAWGRHRRSIVNCDLLTQKVNNNNKTRFT